MPAAEFITAVISSTYFDEVNNNQRHYIDHLPGVIEQMCNKSRVNFSLLAPTTFDTVCNYFHPVNLYDIGFNSEQVTIIFEEFQKEFATNQYCVDNDLSDYILSDDFYNEYMTLYNDAYDSPDAYERFNVWRMNMPVRYSVIASRKEPEYGMNWKPKKPRKPAKPSVIPKECNKINRDWEMLNKVCVDETIRSELRIYGCVLRQTNDGIYEVQTAEDDLTFPARDMLINAIAVERTRSKLRRVAHKETVLSKGMEIKRFIPKGLKVRLADGSLLIGDGEARAFLQEIDQAQKLRNKKNARKRILRNGVNGYLAKEPILVYDYCGAELMQNKIYPVYNKQTRKSHITYDDFLKIRKNSPLLEEVLYCRYPAGFEKRDKTLIAEGEAYFGDIRGLHQQFQDLEERSKAKARQQRTEVNQEVRPTQKLIEKMLTEANPTFTEEYEYRLANEWKRPIKLNKVLKGEGEREGRLPVKSEIHPRRMEKDVATNRWYPIREKPLKKYVQNAKFNENSREAKEALTRNHKQILKPLNINRCEKLLKISESAFFDKDEPTFVQSDKGKLTLPVPEISKDVFEQEYVATYEVQGDEHFLIKQLTLKMGMNGFTIVSGNIVAKVWYNTKSYLTTTTKASIVGLKWVIVGYASVACNGYIRTHDGLFSFPTLVPVEGVLFTPFNTEVDERVPFDVVRCGDAIDCEGDVIGFYGACLLIKEQKDHKSVADIYCQSIIKEVTMRPIELGHSLLTLATDAHYWKYHEMHTGFRQPWFNYYERREWQDTFTSIAEKIESVCDKSLQEITQINQDIGTKKAYDRSSPFFCREGLSRKRIFFPADIDFHVREGITSFFVRIGIFTSYADIIRMSRGVKSENPRFGAYYTHATECCHPAMITIERGTAYITMETYLLHAWAECPLFRLVFDFNEVATTHQLLYAEDFFGKEARDCISKPVNSSYKKFTFAFTPEVLNPREAVVPEKTEKETSPPDWMWGDEFETIFWRYKNRCFQDYLTLDHFTYLCDNNQLDRFIELIPEDKRIKVVETAYILALASIYNGRKGNVEAIAQMNEKRDTMRIELAIDNFEKRGNYKRRSLKVKTNVARSIVYIFRHRRSYFLPEHQKEIDWALDWTKHFPLDEDIEDKDYCIVGFTGLGEAAPEPEVEYRSSDSDDEEGEEEDATGMGGAFGFFNQVCQQSDKMNNLRESGRYSEEWNKQRILNLKREQEEAVRIEEIKEAKRVRANKLAKIRRDAKKAQREPVVAVSMSLTEALRETPKTEVPVRRGAIG